MYRAQTVKRAKSRNPLCSNQRFLANARKQPTFLTQDQMKNGSPHYRQYCSHSQIFTEEVAGASKTWLLSLPRECGVEVDLPRWNADALSTYL